MGTDHDFMNCCYSSGAGSAGETVVCPQFTVTFTKVGLHYVMLAVNLTKVAIYCHTDITKDAGSMPWPQ